MKVELDACIGDSQLVHICGTVPWADVALSRERRHCDCVLQLILGQIVGNASINISLKSTQMQESSFSQLIKQLFYSFSCLCQQLGKEWNTLPSTGGVKTSDSTAVLFITTPLAMCFFLVECAAHKCSITKAHSLVLLLTYNSYVV